MPKTPLRQCVFLLTSVFLIVPGCSWNSDRVPVNHVIGSVFVAGQPASGAKLFFHPASDPTAQRALRPFAEVVPDGTFEVNTYFEGDGAPEGDYLVTIYWPAPKKTPKGKFDDESVPPDRLKDIYSNPKTSKLRAHISKGDNTLEPFQLP
ncbi:hypothetical protein BH10PLA2_BH10PLA2_12520 [soil metagenome]